jgi:acetyl-CoA synthetase
MNYPYLIKSYEQYLEDYNQSIKEPEVFWASIAEHFMWRKKWDRVLEWNFTTPKN